MRPVPSVTEVLAVVGYSDPIDRVPTEALERGTAVHRVLEMIDRGEHPGEAARSLRGYVEAWTRARDRLVLETLGVELRVEHEALGYRGRLDRLAVVRGSHGGRASPAVVEIKTGAPAPWHSIQTAAYALAVESARPDGLPEGPIERWAVYLRPAGRWVMRMHSDPEDMCAWLAALSVYRWRLRHRPESIYGEEGER
jgi:hypothetical protein